MSESGSSHTSGWPSATCTCPSEKGTKVTSQSAPASRRVDDVLVGVAGEGAAIVPGDVESVGHAWCNVRRRTLIPDRSGRPERPRRPPDDVADHRPAHHVRGVVDVHVRAAEAPPWRRGRTRAALRAGSSPLRMAAAQNAALAWPLGKLVVDGVRNRCGRVPSNTGRPRLKRRFTPWLTSTDSTPRRRRQPHGVAPAWSGSRAARPAPTRCQIMLQSPTAEAV